MAGLSYQSKRSKTNKGQDRSDNKTESPKECQRTQILSGIQTNGSIKRFTERTKTKQKTDQSQRGTCKREQNKQTRLLKTSIPLNGVNQISSAKSLDKSATTSKMDKVKGIDMHFIFKKRGHSPDTLKLWTEPKRLLKPEKKRELLAKERTTRDCKSIDLHNRSERELQN